MTTSIGRKKFITALGSATVAWPLAARAQQPAMPVIGVLVSGSAEGYAGTLAPVRQGPSQTGYIEGRNVAIEYRYADEQIGRVWFLERASLSPTTMTK